MFVRLCRHLANLCLVSLRKLGIRRTLPNPNFRKIQLITSIYHTRLWSLVTLVSVADWTHQPSFVLDRCSRPIENFLFSRQYVVGILQLVREVLWQARRSSQMLLHLPVDVRLCTTRKRIGISKQGRGRRFVSETTAHRTQFVAGDPRLFGSVSGRCVGGFFVSFQSVNDASQQMNASSPLHFR